MLLISAIFLVKALLSDAWERFIFVRTLLKSVLLQEGGEDMKKVFEGVVRFYRDAGKVRHLLECTLAADIRGHNQGIKTILSKKQR